MIVKLQLTGVEKTKYHHCLQLAQSQLLAGQKSDPQDLLCSAVPADSSQVLLVLDQLLLDVRMKKMKQSWPVSLFVSKSSPQSDQSPYVLEVSLSSPVFG